MIIIFESEEEKLAFIKSYIINEKDFDTKNFNVIVPNKIEGWEMKILQFIYFHFNRLFTNYVLLFDIEEFFSFPKKKDKKWIMH